MNKVILIGHAGKDADCMPIGATDVSRFSLATSESYIDNSGQRVTITEWHNIKCWKGFAKLAYKYVKKGSYLAIEGKIHNSSYVKDGITRYTSEVVVSDLKFLDKKPEETAPAAPGPAGQQPAPQAAPQDAFGGSVEDDLPF